MITEQEYLKAKQIVERYEQDPKQGFVMFEDIAAVNDWCKRTFKKPLSYKVTSQIALPPDSIVEITVKLPDGRTFKYEGSNQKIAARNWARQFKG